MSRRSHLAEAERGTPPKCPNVECSRPHFLFPTGRYSFLSASSLRVIVSSGLPVGSRRRISSDRNLAPGKPEPPCKSGQLKKDLGLEVRSARHAARLIIFEIMIWI
jgi:hypothetical protein